MLNMIFRDHFSLQWFAPYLLLRRRRETFQSQDSAMVRVRNTASLRSRTTQRGGAQIGKESIAHVLIQFGSLKRIVKVHI
jgi:hypothetical protein